MISMVVVLLVCTTGTWADTIAKVLVLQDGLNGYDGTDDTMLNWDPAGGLKNNGTYLIGQVGNSYLSDPMNSLLRFSGLDVLQGQYSSIDTATLTLSSSAVWGKKPSTEMTATVFQLADGNADWVEGVGNWEDALDGESCGYYKAYLVDPNSTPWLGGNGADGAAGTDVEMGTFTIIPDPNNGTSYNIDLDPTVIEQWINGINAGMLIKDTPRQTDTFPYHSSDSGTPAWRPKLTIEYTADLVCGDPGMTYKDADLNTDCYVNLEDLEVFFSEWLTCTDPINPTDCFLDSEPASDPFEFGWFDSFATSYTNPSVASAMVTEGATNATTYAGESYDMPGDGIATTQAWLDSAYSAGLEVTAGVPYEYVRDKETALLQIFLNTFKDHSAVVGWFLADEPTAGYHDEALLAYNTIKALSDKPVSIVFEGNNNPTLFADAHDIMLMDAYPCKTGEAAFNTVGMNAFKSNMDSAEADAAAMSKPWGAVLQGFGGAPDTLDLRLSTSDEARFMTYYAIQAGASSTVFYPRYRTVNIPARPGEAYPDSGLQWVIDVFEPLADEMNTIREAVGSGTVEALVSDDSSDILTELYLDPYTDDYYLVALNSTSGGESPIFTVNIPGATSAQLLFEGVEMIPITGGQFTDVYGDYEVHVYRLVLE
jgi:hypothetical protein